jgi:predicted transport protein
MGDVKLFDLSSGKAQELSGGSMAIERSLQRLIEDNLETFLGVRFLATEYSTGKTHAGRIDTLGIDENNFPVIIEYKRSLNETVMNQGLFYMHWLLDHRAEFEKLVAKVCGSEVADQVDWNNPRILCIASDFNRYDEHAVKEMKHTIELIRYKRYGENLLLLELVNAVFAKPAKSKQAPVTTTVKAEDSVVPSSQKVVSDYLRQSPTTLQDLYGLVEAFALSLGDDVQKRETKQYHAYRRLKNFLCVVVHPREHRLLLLLKLNPDTIKLEEGFTRDVRETGDGAGSLEVRIYNEADLERAKHLIVASYEKS